MLTPLSTPRAPLRSAESASTLTPPLLPLSAATDDDLIVHPTFGFLVRRTELPPSSPARRNSPAMITAFPSAPLPSSPAPRSASPRITPSTPMAPGTPIEVASPVAAPSRSTLGHLPAVADGIKAWRILVFCTSINSFTQKVLVHLRQWGCEYVQTIVALDDKQMIRDAEAFQPDMVICPFLTRFVPEAIYNKWVTLVVHPGPPGDAGPAALDWVMLGDTGKQANAVKALAQMREPATDILSAPQRSHWGCMVFQASAEVDAGAVWAWEQYPLPPVHTITKSQLYQTLHSSAALLSISAAMLRLDGLVNERNLQSRSDLWVSLQPYPQWTKFACGDRQRFLGGPTLHRPTLTAAQRRPDLRDWPAHHVKRFICASDSQPGAQIGPFVDGKYLFAYDAHVHVVCYTVPEFLYKSRGWKNWDMIPNGAILAQRSGAVFIKTAKCAYSACTECGAGVWVTHGRVPKKAGSVLEPKVPFVDALLSGGHGKLLESVKEWAQDGWDRVEGEYKEVEVVRVKEQGGDAMLVYWSCYNGAMSTRQCRDILAAVRWATALARGNVRALVLMGGHYFSNGINLNTIEHSAEPGLETWENINAIDDIVEFVMSDAPTKDRSTFMGTEHKSLSERGIITMACLRGNAAAGGVALAAACDVVICGRNVVLNPSYRAMGLHGSEIHSFSYTARCGDYARNLLLDMLPLSSSEAKSVGLVDVEVGMFDNSPASLDVACIEQIRQVLNSPPHAFVPAIASAPWCRSTFAPSSCMSLVDQLAFAKTVSWRQRPFPLLHYRLEELGQMILDAYHPVRSKRFFAPRYAFTRKLKSSKTPSRYAKHSEPYVPDIEETAAFDRTPGHVRGIEWQWVGEETPVSIATSEWTRVDLFGVRTSFPATADALNTSAALPLPMARNDLREPKPLAFEQGDTHLSTSTWNKLLRKLSNSSLADKKAISRPFSPPLLEEPDLRESNDSSVHSSDPASPPLLLAYPTMQDRFPISREPTPTKAKQLRSEPVPINANSSSKFGQILRRGSNSVLNALKLSTSSVSPQPSILELEDVDESFVAAPYTQRTGKLVPGYGHEPVYPCLIDAGHE